MSLKLEHFLSVGDRLIDRIETLDRFRKVAHAADLTGVKDSLQLTPACHIVPAGFTLAAQLPRGTKQAWTQRWLTVVVTRSARQAKSGAGAMTLAGPLVSALLAPGFLAGWEPGAGCQPLEAASPPQPSVVLSDAGALYVALEWHVMLKEIPQ
jgi:hypothetical protein